MWNSIHYKSDDIILREGTPAETIYVILEGAVELSVANEKSRELHSGDLFGESGLIHNALATHSVRAISPLHLKEIHKNDFLESIDSEPELARVVMRALLSQAQEMNSRLMELESTTTHGRIMELTTKSSHLNATILRGTSSRAKDALNEQALTVDQFPFHLCRKPANPGPLALMKNYLLLNDEVPYEISQTHCKLIKRDGKTVLVDESSRFGTLINGSSIGRKFSQQECELTPGAHKITLGPSSRSLYSFEIEVT